MVAAASVARVRLAGWVGGGERGCVLVASEGAAEGWGHDVDPDPALCAGWRGGRAHQAVFGDGSIDGGTAGGGCALPAAALACVPVPATATAPASEEADPVTDFPVGSGERCEGEADLWQSADGAVGCGVVSSGVCGVLERLGAEGTDESRDGVAIFDAFPISWYTAMRGEPGRGGCGLRMKSLHVTFS